MSCADPVSQFSPSSLRMHNANELLSPCRSAAEDPAFSFHRQTPKRASTSVFTSPTSSPTPVLSDILHTRYKSSPKGPGCRPRTCYKENFEVTNNTQECKADDAVDEVLCSSGLKINRRNTEDGTNLSFSRSPFSEMGETFSSPPQKTYEGSKSCDLKLVASRKLGPNNEPVDASCSPQTPSSFKRKRPIKLEVPEFARLASFDKAKEFRYLTNKPVASEIEGIDGHSFAVAFKSGRRDCMEDAHVVITNFQKKPDQAFFGIFDGHGGKRVAEFLSQNLIHHIEEAIQDLNGGKDCLGSALRASYMSADAEIADKGLEGGACTISAFLREGQLLVANAGDCKAVLCREGKAEVLSSIHRASNAKERERIQNLGGYVDCFSGTWRVQGTLAVTRSLGDTRMKTWITGEPEVVQLEINKECE
ncbi:hypothetical protein KP509_30G033900 [Ceratopteris richardii]|uniref:protein-serine/threonine phosphatase n=1 Tax=Ceratopteris richardii TaxID=49495 RepID=A0A8T2R347_CERRI|nr:hypothetical protein KP509_30G033900 [Ceratopteris richardii]